MQLRGQIGRDTPEKIYLTDQSDQFFGFFVWFFTFAVMEAADDVSALVDPQ
jgi:hypothetical protein